MNPINRIKIRINIDKVPYGNLNKYNFYYINKKIMNSKDRLSFFCKEMNLIIFLSSKYQIEN